MVGHPFLGASYSVQDDRVVDNRAAFAFAAAVAWPSSTADSKGVAVFLPFRVDIVTPLQNIIQITTTSDRLVKVSSVSSNRCRKNAQKTHAKNTIFVRFHCLCFDARKKPTSNIEHR